MKNLLAAVAVAFAPVFAPALAADGTNLAGDEEEPTMSDLNRRMDGLEGKIDTLTTKVDAFAGRGHQVAVVMTVPKTLRVPHEAVHVDYHLVGSSTIPGFPSGTVAADGKFASWTAPLPAGTYLFEMQQPYSDNVLCHGNVSRLHGGRGDGGTKKVCPRILLFGHSPSGQTRFDDGFAIYTMTTNTGHFLVKHRFPAGFTFTTDRPLGSYRGAVKITKLK